MSFGVLATQVFGLDNVDFAIRYPDRSVGLKDAGAKASFVPLSSPNAVCKAQKLLVRQKCSDWPYFVTTQGLFE